MKVSLICSAVVKDDSSYDCTFTQQKYHVICSGITSFGVTKIQITYQLWIIDKCLKIRIGSQNEVKGTPCIEVDTLLVGLI